jgi:cytochrome c553
MKTVHGRSRSIGGAAALLAPILAVAVAACAHIGGVRATPEATLQMHDNFGDLLQIRRALIMGDLEGAREPAEHLAAHVPHPDLPSESLRHVDEMTSEATRLAVARDLPTAARAAASIAASCGACHGENDVGPEFVIGVPPDRPDMTSHMIRYSWALNRFWQGLVAPSDEAWQAGSDIIAETTIGPDEFARRGLEAEDGAAMYAAIKHLGERARPARSSTREEILAELWVSCAGCHELVGLEGP